MKDIKALRQKVPSCHRLLSENSLWYQADRQDNLVHRTKSTEMFGLNPFYQDFEWDLYLLYIFMVWSPILYQFVGNVSNKQWA